MPLDRVSVASWVYISVFPDPVTPFRSTGLSAANPFRMHSKANSCAGESSISAPSISLQVNEVPFFDASMSEIALSLANSALFISSCIFLICLGVRRRMTII